MVDERAPLPESFGGLWDIALRAFARRGVLYLAAAAAAIAVQGIAAAVDPRSAGLAIAANIVADSFIAVLVTLGVIADIRSSEPVDGRNLLSAALERWWLVAAVGLLITPVNYVAMEAIFEPATDISDVFLLPIIIVGWGTLNFATVIAASDTKTPTRLLVFTSIGRSVALALARPNLGRLALISLIALLPALLEQILGDQLMSRHFAASQFFATVPVDALTAGPLQAVFTVFYLDFIRRTTK